MSRRKGYYHPKKMNRQAESLLFQKLPQEMRDRIFREVFSGTRFAVGFLLTSLEPFGGHWLYPAPNGLSLLLTCRRAHLEIGDSWMRYVLFSFEDTHTMLDMLSALPAKILSNIRHVRVKGNPISLSYPETSISYCLSSVLALLPGLQLDQLTVIATHFTSYLNYSALCGLIQEGNGWKTLRYISSTSELLGFPSRHVGSGPCSVRDWDKNPNYVCPIRVVYDKDG